VDGFKDNSFAGSALVFFLKILFPDFPKIFSGNIFPEHFEKNFRNFLASFRKKFRKNPVHEKYFSKTFF